MGGFLGGGFFGSGGKSSETSTNTQEAGFSNVDGPATSLNVTGADSVTLNQLDDGAIGRALDFAGEALNFAQATQSGSQAADAAQVSKAYQLADQARQSETSGAINNVLTYGALVLVVGIIAWAATRKR